jgi:hypothetical protein
MQVRCIKQFGISPVGKIIDIPDGSVTDPEYWEVIPDVPLPDPPAPPAAIPSAAAVTPKEM